MTSQTADSTKSFSTLAAQNARTAACSRISLQGALLLWILAASTVLLVVDIAQMRRINRYASALRSAASSAPKCDFALARRRLWLGPVVVSHALCVSHSDDRAADTTVTTTRTEVKSQPHFSFLVVGDWGRDGMCCQRDVALEMAALANRTRPAFVVSTGDNFYKRGLVAATDRQVGSSWRDVYLEPHASLRREWKLVLGNHDHSGNPTAQMELSNTEKHWHMPHPYYFETVGDGQVFMAFIDTAALYYKPDQSQMSMFQREFVTPQYRDHQLQALETALANSSAPWKIVVGHHPIFSSGQNSLSEMDNLALMQERLLPVLKKFGVVAYFCGHEHTLEHHERDGIHSFVSGGGSKVSNVVKSKWKEEIFALDRQGFAQVSLEKDADTMKVTFFDLRGAAVHEASLRRPA